MTVEYARTGSRSGAPSARSTRSAPPGRPALSPRSQGRSHRGGSAVGRERDDAGRGPHLAAAAIGDAATSWPAVPPGPRWHRYTWEHDLHLLCGGSRPTACCTARRPGSRASAGSTASARRWSVSQPTDTDNTDNTATRQHRQHRQHRHTDTPTTPTTLTAGRPRRYRAAARTWLAANLPTREGRRSAPPTTRHRPAGRGPGLTARSHEAGYAGSPAARLRGPGPHGRASAHLAEESAGYAVPAPAASPARSRRRSCCRRSWPTPPRSRSGTGSEDPRGDRLCASSSPSRPPVDLPHPHPGHPRRRHLGDQRHEGVVVGRPAADYGICLARTDWTSEARGLTWFKCR